MMGSDGRVQPIRNHLERGPSLIAFLAAYCLFAYSIECASCSLLSTFWKAKLIEYLQCGDVPFSLGSMSMERENIDYG
jgi:hypothetical protein